MATSQTFSPTAPLPTACSVPAQPRASRESPDVPAGAGGHLDPGQWLGRAGSAVGPALPRDEELG